MAMRIIWFALPSDIFHLVSACTTANEIWDRLNELYVSDADLEHSVQTLLLSESGAFAQKSDEKLDQMFNRFNHLLSRMLKHNLRCEVIEQKFMFMNGLRSESKSCGNSVGIPRSHEDEVTKEVKIVSSMGSLELVAMGKKVTEDDSESVRTHILYAWTRFENSNHELMLKIKAWL